jgi:hypothetical protein
MKNIKTASKAKKHNRASTTVGAKKRKRVIKATKKN